MMRITKISPLMLYALTACGSEATQPPPIVPELSIVAGNLQIDTIGKTLPTQVAAMLRDKQTGAPLAGRIVNWVVINGGGSVFASVVQTGLDGMARQTWTLGMTPGGQTLVARWLNPDTGEPVTIDTAKATALPRATMLVNNSAGPMQIVVHWQTGGEDTATIRGYGTTCAFLSQWGPAYLVQLNGGARVDSTPRDGSFIGGPHWVVAAAGPGGGSLGYQQGSGIPACTP